MNKYNGIKSIISKIEMDSSENELILEFEDEINEASLDNLFIIAEKRLETSIEEKKIKKKIFNVLVECLQNILKHGEENTEKDNKIYCNLIIGQNLKSYFIYTGNIIENEKGQKLSEKINVINSLNEEELKMKYYEVMNNENFSEKGGAGLGLMDIVRKSGNKLEYFLKTIDQQSSFITLKATISLPF